MCGVRFSHRIGNLLVTRLSQYPLVKSSASRMGAGASADNARHTVSSMLMNKPEDASDISDLDKAKAEIISLRKMAKLYQEHLSGECRHVHLQLLA